MRQGIADVLPLSPLQEGLLFQSQLAGERDAYTVQLRFELGGDVDQARLRAAIAALLDRHPNLRAGFRHAGLSRPVQVVPRAVETDFTVVDLSCLTPQAARAEAGELARAERDRPFDLQRPPLLRAMQITRPDQRHTFVLTLHHILLDGWSLPIVVQELFDLYARDGDAAGMPPAVPYKGFLGWLAKQDSAAAERAWAEALEDLPAPTLLAGTDGGSTGGGAPDHVKTLISGDLARRLRERAKAEGLTLNSVVQGAWAVLLARMTGQTDVVFGASVSGRPPELPGADRMVGLLINTVPVRVRLQPQDELADVLRRMQREQGELLAHQHLGLADIQRASGHGALFDTIAVFENYPMDPAALTPSSGGLTVHELQVDEGTHYPLGLVVEMAGDGLLVRVDYAADTFTAAEAEDALGRVVRLLETFADGLDVPAGRVAMLTADETAELISARNELTGFTAEPVTLGIAEQFAHMADTYPRATAVTDGATTLTYAELDVAANKLARLLLEDGVRPGDFVAVALPRSTELVVAILATLKAGAAYVPVDPYYPADRIAFLLGDSAPRLVVTDSTVAERLPDTGAHRIELDRSRRRLADASPANPRVEVAPSSPAYVIYTSGSTGKPKGVVVPHANVVRLFSATRQWFTFGPDDVWTLFHSCAFDFSVWELWGALLHGGALVVVDYDTSRSPERFLALLADERVTVLNQTPSAFYQLIAAQQAAPELADRLALRYVVFGGEALDLWRLGDWYRYHADDAPTLINMYGITETTVHVSYLALDSGSAAEATGSRIGRAIPDLRIYVLDDNLLPAAPGVAGEMYVAGEGLADGYHRRPGLTASRFVADPFGPPGARMYRSGDVARWLPGGGLEFVGRADQQVKIRGFRIELGEIEQVLAGHPDVGGVAVIVREDAPGDQRLVAYVVPDGARVPGAQELRAHAASALPDYMVPSAFVLLDELPLTGNGKLDRKALPAPVADAAGSVAAPSAGAEASGQVVEILAGLFAEVLDVPAVGKNDNFFDLGGHSLLAVRLISKIRSALGAEVSIRTLFESPTPAMLHAALDPADDARPALCPMPRPDVLPQSFAQRRLWFLNQLAEDGAAYNVPLALRLCGDLDVQALRSALGDVVARHEPLRTVFPEADGVGIQQVLDPAEAIPELAVDEVDEQRLDAEITARLAKAFDITHEPPLRAHLLRFGAAEHVLLLVLHHIAADGWSLRTLADDLSAAYRARRDGNSDGLEPLPVGYTDYTLWQRELLGSADEPGSVLSTQLDFWRETLAGLPAELALPSDRPRPAQPDSRGGSVTVDVPADVHEQLRALARHSGTSLFMVLQAGLAALLTRMGCGTDIPIGAPLAGRTDAAVEVLVGFFVNSLVLRCDTAGDPEFAELLRRVRETDLAAFAHQDVPFERVIDAVNPERSPARHPLFQVVLSLQNNPSWELDLAGLDVEPLRLSAATSKFDLCFDVTECSGETGGPGGLRIDVDYSVAMFDAETVGDLGRRLVRLLGAVAADPAVPVSAIELADAEETERLLAAGRGPDVPVAGVSVDELIARRAGTDPAAVAVSAEDGRLTYAELDAAANRLARVLIERGAGPERFVAIALERRTDLVVALLAALKTGAGYLPLDPSYPADRIEYMLTDAQPAVLVTDSAVAPELPDSAGETVLLDDPVLAADLARMPATAIGAAELLGERRMADPAYVIYTSGSTGRPKGVVIEHRALATYLDWTARAYPATRGLAVVHSPISFDLTVTALYTCLVAGGRVHLAELEDSDATRQVLAEQPCTFGKATPSHLGLLGALPEAYSPSGQLLLGGETLTADALAQFRARHPQTTVHNVYGQTETTVNCAELVIPAGAELTPGALAVGRPFANVRIAVLDEALRPVAHGAVGEIYVAGGQLGRGYLNRAALTAARFVADPYGPPGGRMYRTGDLGRWRRAADGGEPVLEFAGRVDDQVKVRGFRIELGEIEAVVAAHPAVRDARVTVREDSPGDRRLVGYVVPVAQDELSSVELRTHASAALPDYMVPSAFVALAELPLTPNGKLDRDVLPAPDFATVATGTQPRTATEETMTELFAEVLGLPAVGIEDNFFDLGGDSIISIQLVAKARRSGLVITPRTVFEHKTPAALAMVARSLDETADGEPDVGTGDVAMTPAVARFAERGGPVDGYNQSMLLRAPEGMTTQRLIAAAQAVIDHHDTLRMRLARDGTRWSMTIDEPGTTDAADLVSTVDIAGLDAELARARISAESKLAWTRTAPEAGRQLCLSFFDAGGGGADRVLITAHHLVVDSVSWRILIADLAQAFDDVLAGREPQLQPVGTSFRRWAQHLQAAAYTPQRVAELDRWTDTLAGYEPLIGERPLDPAQDTVADMRWTIQRLDPELTGPLLGEVASAYHAGPNEVLLTALTIAINRWRADIDTDDPFADDADTSAVLVDLEGHGREEVAEGIDTSRTVGWFTSRYPVRLDLAGAEVAGDVQPDAVGPVLRSVKETLRAVPDGGIGYGLLRYLNHDTRLVLQDELDPQISFNYLGRFDAGGDDGAAWSAVSDAETVGGADLSGGRPDPRTPMAHTLSVNALTEDRLEGPELVIVWSWPAKVLAGEQAQRLTECFADAVRAVVAHGQSEGAGGFTPSDLGLVSLTQDQIDAYTADAAVAELSDDADDADFETEWEMS